MKALEGRIALCSYSDCRTNPSRSTHYGQYNEAGRSFAPSSSELPFFKHLPERQHDQFYCGCWGWD
jgi:hypothetical protein